MTEHAEICAICDACAAGILEHVSKLEGRKRVPLFCSHGQSLVDVVVVDGRIVEWRIMGPITGP